MIRVCNFSSGSDGNCTYVEINEKVRVLVDAGISSLKIVSSLKKIGIQPKQIDAVLLTHEHSDHIKGADVFASKYNINVYAHKNIWGELDKNFTRLLSIYKHIHFDNPFNIAEAEIESINISHDARHTSAFKISDGKNSISIITDLGHWDEHIINFARDSTLVYIESNHDEDLLRVNPNYSFHLKARILSQKGHLSNNQCAMLIERLAGYKTKQFVLSHLSRENNSPSLAYQSVCSYLASKNIIEGKHIKIDVASTEMGSIFKII